MLAQLSVNNNKTLGKGGVDPASRPRRALTCFRAGEPHYVPANHNR